MKGSTQILMVLIPSSIPFFERWCYLRKKIKACIINSCKNNLLHFYPWVWHCQVRFTCEHVFSTVHTVWISDWVSKPFVLKLTPFLIAIPTFANMINQWVFYQTVDWTWRSFSDLWNSVRISAAHHSKQTLAFCTTSTVYQKFIVVQQKGSSKTFFELLECSISGNGGISPVFVWWGNSEPKWKHSIKIRIIRRLGQK